MDYPPKEIDGAEVIWYAVLDENCRPTSACTHLVAGITLPPASALAICPYDAGEGYFLFYCDAEWTILTDTWHSSIDAAMKQAEFEYEGITGTWQRHA